MWKTQIAIDKVTQVATTVVKAFSALLLPVAAWWEPKVFTRWKEQGEAMGIDHVESSPLTRSSYHAREAADAAARP